MTDTQMTDDDLDAAHKKRMERLDAAVEKKLAAATDAKRLLIVYTGDGKGKTTAALGMAWRALGHGMRVGVVQFIKGTIATGEEMLARRLDLPLEFHVMGEGFTWKTQDRQRDIAAARRGWQKAAELLNNPAVGLVILDELNIVLDYGYLPTEEVVRVVSARAQGQHVVITGRGAPEALCDAADLVSEMTAVKHPFAEGIKPQVGVEY